MQIWTNQGIARSSADRPPGKTEPCSRSCFGQQPLLKSRVPCHLSHSLGAVQLSRAGPRPLSASHPALHFHQVAGPLSAGIIAAGDTVLVHNLVCQQPVALRAGQPSSLQECRECLPWACYMVTAQPGDLHQEVLVHQMAHRSTAQERAVSDAAQQHAECRLYLLNAMQAAKPSCLQLREHVAHMPVNMPACQTTMHSATNAHCTCHVVACSATPLRVGAAHETLSRPCSPLKQEASDLRVPAQLSRVQCQGAAVLLPNHDQVVRIAWVKFVLHGIEQLQLQWRA